MKLEEKEFFEAIKIIEDLFQKELLSIIDEDNHKRIAESLYKSALYAKLLDTNYIISDTFNQTMNKLIKTISPLKRDEIFSILVLFTKTVLDTLSIIPDTENKPIVVDITEVFSKVLNIFNTGYEIPNLSTVETKCIVCGKPMIVDKEKENFANICKSCKGV